MKTMAPLAYLTAVVAALACIPLTIASAADTNSAPADAAPTQSSTTANPQTPAVVASPKLPYGVDDVLKLSRAQVGDEIILNYIRNSGTIYTLGPQEIVYLRNQGVSDRVINAMIDQRRVVAQATQPAPQPPAIANAPQVPDASLAPAAPVYNQTPPTYAEAPMTPPPSTVYVVPSPSYSYPYYYPYPYSYGYYGPYWGGYYGGPVVSFGFRFGGHRGFGHGWHRR